MNLTTSCRLLPRLTGDQPTSATIMTKPQSTWRLVRTTEHTLLSDFRVRNVEDSHNTQAGISGDIVRYHRIFWNNIANSVSDSRGTKTTNISNTDEFDSTLG